MEREIGGEKEREGLEREKLREVEGEGGSWRERKGEREGGREESEGGGEGGGRGGEEER